MKKLVAFFALLLISTSSFAVFDQSSSTLVVCNNPNVEANLTVYVYPKSSSSGFYYISSPDDSNLTGNYTFIYPIVKRTFRVKNTTENSFVVVTDFETLTPVVISCE